MYPRQISDNFTKILFATKYCIFHTKEVALFYCVLHCVNVPQFYNTTKPQFYNYITAHFVHGMLYL